MPSQQCDGIALQGTMLGRRGYSTGFSFIAPSDYGGSVASHRSMLIDVELSAQDAEAILLALETCAALFLWSDQDDGRPRTPHEIAMMRAQWRALGIETVLSAHKTFRHAVNVAAT